MHAHSIEFTPLTNSLISAAAHHSIEQTTDTGYVAAKPRRFSTLSLSIACNLADLKFPLSNCNFLSRLVSFSSLRHIFDGTARASLLCYICRSNSATTQSTNKYNNTSLSSLTTSSQIKCSSLRDISLPGNDTNCTSCARL